MDDVQYADEVSCGRPSSLSSSGLPFIPLLWMPSPPTAITWLDVPGCLPPPDHQPLGSALEGKLETCTSVFLRRSLFARAAPLLHWLEVSGSWVVATELREGRTSLGRSDLSVPGAHLGLHVSGGPPHWPLLAADAAVRKAQASRGLWGGVGERLRSPGFNLLLSMVAQQCHVA